LVTSASIIYGDLVREYAREKGLGRWLISVPLLAPYLFNPWLTLMTPTDGGRQCMIA
jgi:hypothetical protein